MIYRVRYMPRVIAAIDEQVEYLFDNHVSPERVSAWLSKLYEQADSLETLPKRHRVDAKTTAEIGVEIRVVVVGDYLLFYRVSDADQCVDVVHFRHSAQETNRLTEDAL